MSEPTPKASWASRVTAFWRHAFALRAEPLSPELLLRRDEWFGRLSRELVQRNMGTTALLVLESLRPAGGLAAASLTLLRPVLDSVFHGDGMDGVLRLLEDRRQTEVFLRRLEQEMKAEPKEAEPHS